MKQNLFSTKEVCCIFFISLFLFLTACVEKVIPPPISIPDEFVNQQIKIRVAPVLNTLKTSDDVMLELKYNSNNVIVFPYDYNVRIFQKSNDKWLEIYEIPELAVQEHDVIFAPNIELPAVQVIFLSPDLRDYSKPYQLRVYAIGEMQITGGKQEVAAYVDFELSP